MAVLLLVYAAGMGVATFVESTYGTALAKAWVYNNAWFFILHLLLICNFAGVAIRRGLLRQKKWAALIFHHAFAVIMLGALVTFWTGKEGFIHIREGDSSRMMMQEGQRLQEELPFEVELTDFRLVRYPGSNSPSSYESDVIIRQIGEVDRYEKIYMNNVLHVAGYRLYQSSYDRDERGTILTVNHDLAGMIITYTGYVLLLGGMIVALFHRHSRFRSLSRSLARSAVVAAAVLSLSAQSAAAQEGVMALDRQRDKRMAQVYAVDAALDRDVAREFGKLMVQESKGRVEPVDTYAAKLLRKIYRKNSYNGLSADQVILGVIMQPNVWSRVPFISVSSDRLRSAAGGGDQGGYLAFIDVLNDQGEYIFEDQVQQVYAKPVRERNKYEKELLKLDEKVNILMSLFEGRMFPILPDGSIVKGAGQWYSPGDDLTGFHGRDSMFVTRIFPWFATESLRVLNQGEGDWGKVRDIIGLLATYQHAKSKDMEHVDAGRIGAEILYNRLSVFKLAGFGLMGVGLALFLVLSLGIGNEQRRGMRIGVLILTGVIIGLFLWTSFGIGLRWYISGRPPVSNAYESMVFIGWAAALGGGLFVRKSRMTLALAAFLAGVLLFVSSLNWMDPEITPLVPVLKSPWLMVHVATITGSYGLFGIGFLLGLISLIMMAFRSLSSRDLIDRQVREFTTINEMLLIAGLVLLTAGTFIGAVWANESWGRYWGWDPKETWALITMAVYAFITHARFIPAIGGTNGARYPYAFSLMSVIGMGSVLMTFFGVNYFLGGMHSYAGDSVPSGLYAVWVVYAVVAVVAVLAWRKGLR